MTDGPGTAGSGPRAIAALTVAAEPLADGRLLRPVGELDHDSADPMREALAEALREPSATVVVDCSGLSFCDSTGLNLLLRTRLAAESAGSRMVLAEPSPMVARMLEITGAGGVFEVYGTVAEATAGGPAG
ncbi:STAS domain-containing protein [Kitasatospora sp. NPDC059571]|uniref:STAS domain-containing protein n=1 Tax=Kitasatospora sp. NPDC059571 TaxID=3346871 RepID=UPI0036B1B057